MENKKHWYDGWIYDRIVAPNQKGVFERIEALIREESDVIDIGCGTGRLAFKLAGKSRSILGIDLSQTNIRRADSNLKNMPDDKIAFKHSDLAALLKDGTRHFDYAVLSFVIHEVNEDERVVLLKEAGVIADKIIICDHLPDTSVFAAITREAVEFLAGREHYRNFRSFVEKEGIIKLAKESGFKIIHEEIYKSHLQIIICSK